MQDLRGEVEKVAQFLGKSLTEEKMTKLLEHLKFDNISKNESVNFEIGKKIGFMNQDGAFIRKGKQIPWPKTLLKFDNSNDTDKSWN